MAGPRCRPARRLSAAAIGRALLNGEADRGVAAIENSLQGSVTDTVDLLIHESITVCGEIVLPIEHCLMCHPSRDIGQIDVIYSHPQSLGQCRRYLESHYANVRTEAALSNAEAVAVMMRTPRSAAIGPERAADIYGARIIERGIEDSPLNKTLFVVRGRESAARTGCDKTSIAFAGAHGRPGRLVGV